jgi:squalene synthase HpnC
MALEHYENFPVLSRFVPAELRAPFAAVYAFARVTDDIGDEIGVPPERRLEALRRWEVAFEVEILEAGESRTEEAWRGDSGSSDHAPVLAAVARTIREHGLSLEPFRTLILANRMDQLRSRYETYAELLDSCALSANPVGRIVLELLGSRDDAHLAASDAVCTGLQLANHWQGIGEDLRWRDRLYVPREDMARFGVREDDLRRDRPGRAVRRLVGHLVDRTRVLLETGSALPGAFAPRHAAVLRLFTRGGLAILDEIEARQADLLRGRIRVPRRRALWLLASEELRLAAATWSRRNGG